jgi:prepilin-type processing-associated H-X9-DG protein
MVKSRNLAFSLTELLIVIAVITLLTALLFPVLSRSRERARQSTCTSNAHQFALAVLQYAGDHDETFLPLRYEASGEVEWTAMLTPYVKSEQIFKCPSDTSSRDISYGLNQLVFLDLEEHPAAQPVKLAEMQSPSQTVLLGETGSADDFATARPDTSKLLPPSEPLTDAEDARPYPRHFDLCTVAFFDGHVKPMRLSQFYTGQTPRDKWFAP